jgi:hypothetical protein
MKREREKCRVRNSHSPHRDQYCTSTRVLDQKPYRLGSDEEDGEVVRR